MVGLISSTQGQIKLNDQDITELPIHARARAGMGYLPQEPSIFRKLSVQDNILAILELRRDLTSEQRQQHLEQLLHEFNIHTIRDTLGISLSWGGASSLRLHALWPWNLNLCYLMNPLRVLTPFLLSISSG